MKITEDTRCALDAIGYIHSQLELNEEAPRTSSKELSKALKLSEHHLSLILGKLRRGRILVSKKGPGGGYLLKITLDKLSLNNILKAIGQPIQLTTSKREHSPLCKELEKRLQLEMTNVADLPLSSFL